MFLTNIRGFSVPSNVDILKTQTMNPISANGFQSSGNCQNIEYPFAKKYVDIDYLMVGLRYGCYPRVAGVISRTSEVRASE